MCDEYIRCKIWFSVCDEDVGCDLIDVIYGVYCVICLMGYYNAFYDLKRFFYILRGLNVVFYWCLWSRGWCLPHSSFRSGDLGGNRRRLVPDFGGRFCPGQEKYEFLYRTVWNFFNENGSNQFYIHISVVGISYNTYYSFIFSVISVHNIWCALSF